MLFCELQNVIVNQWASLLHRRKWNWGTYNCVILSVKWPPTSCHRMAAGVKMSVRVLWWDAPAIMAVVGIATIIVLLAADTSWCCMAGSVHDRWFLSLFSFQPSPFATRRCGHSRKCRTYRSELCANGITHTCTWWNGLILPSVTVTQWSI